MKLEKYKRFRVRYTATVDITCYIAAPLREPAYLWNDALVEAYRRVHHQ